MYEQEIAEQVRELPPEKQREVLDLAASLNNKTPKRPRNSIEGALSHLNVQLTREDFEEARREAWKNFPRELPD